MAVVNRIGGDLLVTGKLYIGDNIVNQSSGPILGADDTDHQHCFYFFVSGTPTDANFPLATMIGAGTILNASIWVITPCLSGATIDVDFKKNGTTILSSALQLDDADAARAVVEVAPPNVTTFADGDVFEAAVDVTAGGGTVGVDLWGGIWVNQDYASG